MPERSGPRPKTPALDLWRERVKRGLYGNPEAPDASRMDALWRAAGWEQAAVEAWLQGLTRAAVDGHLKQAREVLAEDADERKQRTA